MLRIMILNTSDSMGGAHRAAHRLHKGLRSINIDSRIRVQNKYSDDPHVYGPDKNTERLLAMFRYNLDQLRLFPYRSTKGKGMFSPAWLPARDASIADFEPDIIHMHWICGGYQSIEALAKYKKPLVWTMHDMWPFTGGCHYSDGCQKYESSCNACPILGSDNKNDLSHKTWKRKQKIWKHLDLHIVSPSRWLASCAKNSRLLGDKPIHTIANGIDTNEFKPVDKKIARDVFGIDTHKKVILFGAASAASDKRKGFHLLFDAIKILADNISDDDLQLLIFGSSEPRYPPDFGIETKYLGQLNDNISLVMLYSAADLFVLPSLEDNLPNTIMEAMACGLPCVGHNVGGVSDMIEHRETGYLSEPLSSEDLASGMSWVLHDESHWKALSDASVAKARKEYTDFMIAEKYHSLYKNILSRNSAK